MTGDPRILRDAERIVIFGCSGSGKSTLARELGRVLNLPVVHLDALFWRPGWVATPREEFAPIVRREAERDRWIIDGGYHNTMKYRLARCDAVIYLDLPRRVCLFRATVRAWKYRRRARPDMAEGCNDKMDRAFWTYIWTYRKRQRPQDMGFLDEAGRERVLVLERREDAGDLLRRLRESSV